jgi:hypothetical protein
MQHLFSSEKCSIYVNSIHFLFTLFITLKYLGFITPKFEPSEYQNPTHYSGDFVRVAVVIYVPDLL